MFREAFAVACLFTVIGKGCFPPSPPPPTPPPPTPPPPTPPPPGGTCVTVGGPASGRPCVFPFRFGGVTYNQCTFEGNQPGETEPWCSTLTDSSGNHIGGQGNWGFCPSNCGTVGPTPPPGTFPPAARCSRIGSTNPEETGDYFEGDIKLTGGSSKVFTNDPSERWPSGVVPYVIEGSFDSGARSRIDQAAAKFNTGTGGCVRWVRRSSQSDYVGIQNSASGCWSLVGRSGGRQPLNLANGCTGSGTIEHEMLHALGMWHEQSRPDRDQFVRINFENIRSGTESNFRKINAASATLIGDYDYSSVMHYSRCAFSANNVETITSPRGVAIGQRSGMSREDINKLMAFYGC